MPRFHFVKDSSVSVNHSPVFNIGDTVYFSHGNKECEVAEIKISDIEIGRFVIDNDKGNRKIFNTYRYCFDKRIYHGSEVLFSVNYVVEQWSSPKLFASYDEARTASKKEHNDMMRAVIYSICKDLKKDTARRRKMH